jgi:EpsI family protein
MSKQIRSALIATILMVLSAGLAWAMTPTHRIVDQIGRLDIEKGVPLQFGDWKLDPLSNGAVVNPQLEAEVEKIYTATVSRAYINSQGERIMLSVAYGADQRDSMQLHYPEICYPAQGFQITGRWRDQIGVAQGAIPIQRLETVLGERRYEPVSYWTMIGDHAVLKGSGKKAVELEYGLKGQIPDGLLFRVSSIDRDSAEAFKLQDRFISDIVKAMTPANRLRLAGIAS